MYGCLNASCFIHGLKKLSDTPRKAALPANTRFI
jgi:hypothetical protein